MDFSENSEGRQNEFSVVLKEKDGRFCLLIPELSIVVVNRDLQTADNELKNQKELVLERAAEWGVQEELGFPVKRRAVDRHLLALRPFLVKSALILVMGASTLIVTAKVLTSEMSRLPAKQLSRAAVDGILSGLRRSVIANTETQRAEKLGSVSKFVDDARPFAKEIWRLLPEDEQVVLPPAEKESK